ncbi:hypothetical protein BH10CYA1_BH10CYA1_20140 [soil metagenome]
MDDHHHRKDQHSSPPTNPTQQHKVKRRDFIVGAAGAVTTIAIGGCGGQKLNVDLQEATTTQKARKKEGRSTVGLIQCPSYEEDIFQAIKPYIASLGLPDLKGKTVVLKPNMVEFHPVSPITTNPHAIWAAVQLADYLGAKEIIIGEGPGHMRDTEFLLDASGIGKLCKTHKLRYVDLNLDDLEKVENVDGFSKLKTIFLPKTIMHADAVISVPKMKTHHWVGMTASMKNLFGTVPGRKYGWPKNILHLNGIPHCILDLVHLVKPQIAFVDAIVAMEGDGPIAGTAKNTGFIAIGTDLAAVDSTCARTMEIPIEKLLYLRMAGQVIGNIDAAQIDIQGASLDSLKQKFEMPITFADRKLLKQSDQGAG